MKKSVALVLALLVFAGCVTTTQTGQSQTAPPAQTVGADQNAPPCTTTICPGSTAEKVINTTFKVLVGIMLLPLVLLAPFASEPYVPKR